MKAVCCVLVVVWVNGSGSERGGSEVGTGALDSGECAKSEDRQGPCNPRRAGTTACSEKAKPLARAPENFLEEKKAKWQKVDSLDCGGVVYGTTVQLRFRSSVRNTAHRDRVGELREQGIGGLDSHKVTVRVDRKDRA
ncbi:uncharacterized protein UBRO_06479 [Ustilago bromivora]|uniref:Uncharacterized protein n=1 Tax=Ustilago bromivora TaxID=307758 RepID=A0A1K0HGQ7_9BASI|nr:uncharacterized protein UBRO_06479 [Ustilago bromivora]